ncbi:50S ribosomal protein L11 methyltransferase [Thiomicrorhabdus heinhorstiae]|uniref:Ribosomal protein L11 methyltransferase n=1 Tax=Thiomicrorhabdus heinhorstiae TaxID=2748010 RepID=A0ABS0BWK9_9GAMM|nr:50S ribosomal protein L11 methyltransferase [Thiomicrorhabdus heinhorstiae]MBF6058198.1 50S ribosomal protein L11 methyltransferase [Thiomicrorhabdus heinhorstiae]
MAWIQISTTTEEALAETLSDAFSECGAVSVTFEDALDQPIFEPDIGTTPIWQNTRVSALFDAKIEVGGVLALLKQLLPAVSEHTFKIEAIEDKDWVREWMDQFQPLSFGKRLWIVPSWLEAPDPQGVNLMLDPGLAFGTGTHPTTALCLEWLDSNAPEDLSVIDYGCGSGILALAAKKLGASSVCGTDIDPQAITASLENAARNAESIPFNLVKDFDSQPVDLLLANILAGPLKELAAEFERLMKPGAQLVLSGLLASQADELIQHYKNFGIELTELRTREEWGLLSGRKHSV